MRYCIAVLIGLLMLGCSTPGDLSKVEVGMTREQVVAVMGHPSSVSAIQNTVYLNYNIQEISVPQQIFMSHFGITGEVSGAYYVRLINGHVESFGKLGDFNSTHIPEQQLDVNVNINGSTPPLSIQPATTFAHATFDQTYQDGLAALNNKQFKLAADLLQQATILNRDSVEAWTGLGLARGGLHDWPNALYTFQHALTIDSNQVAAWAGLAGVYEMTGKTNKYLEALSRVRQIDPAMADAEVEWLKEEHARETEK